MFSDSPSSSESDISTSSGSFSLEADVNFQRYRRRRVRRESITSVSTNPGEEAYVMVLQNRQDIYDDIKSMTSVKDICDVTFLVGDERKPVEGVRAFISSRSSLLNQLILSHEKNCLAAKNAKKSRIMKTLTKINKLGCVHGNRARSGTGSDAMKKLTIPMEAFDENSFQRLIKYLHCGTLTVDASTVIGLLNAAYMFDLPEVQQACWSFALGCVVQADNLRDLLTSAKKYTGHKMTHELMKMLKKYKDSPTVLSHSQTLSQLANEVFEQAELEAGVNVT